MIKLEKFYKCLRVLVLFIMMGLLSSCLLKTRKQVENEKVQQAMSSQVALLQKNNADYVVKTQTIEDENRALKGRLEVIEQKLSQKETFQDQKNQDFHTKLEKMSRQMVLMREALGKIEGTVQARARNSRKKVEEKKIKGNYSRAEAAFSSKDWKAAILSYQKYLDLNPKGRFKSKALYRIGVCFQELGNKQVAATFYHDAIDYNSKSTYGKKAKYRLKQVR